MLALNLRRTRHSKFNITKILCNPGYYFWPRRLTKETIISRNWKHKWVTTLSFARKPTAKLSLRDAELSFKYSVINMNINNGFHLWYKYSWTIFVLFIWDKMKQISYKKLSIFKKKLNFWNQNKFFIPFNC